MFMIKPLKEALEESYTKIKEQEIAQLYASCYKTAWGCGTARCSFFRI